MKNAMTKAAIAAGLLATIALAATPSEARWRGGGWGTGAAVAGGIVAGAAVGAAVASSPYYYGDGYYYGAGPYAYDTYYGAGPYAYDSGYYGDGYAYGPGYATNTYAYAPGGYVAGGYVGAQGPGGCWKVTDSDRGFGYYGACAAPTLSKDARAKKHNPGQ